MQASCLDCISGIFSGPSPYFCKISFFFLILLDLHLYLASTYPVIFLWVFNVLSLPFFLLTYSARVQGFVLTLTFLHVYERLHQLTQGASSSVSELEPCVYLWSSFSISLTYHAFTHIMECVRIPELHSIWLKLNHKWDLILSSCKRTFSQWYQTRINST